MNVFEGYTGRQQRSANNRFQRTALRAAAEPERWAAEIVSSAEGEIC
jgi:hypothetical protein